MGTPPARPRLPGAAPRLLALLLGLAGAAAPPPWPVSGVLAGSVLFSLDLPRGWTVKEIDWTFTNSSGVTTLVAEVGPGGFGRPDPQDRFGERLEVYSESGDQGLRIRDLERGDSGIYQARIKVRPTRVENRFFNLSVYEPVPPPEIQIQRQSRTSRECNLTLRCQVPAGSGAQAAWQPGVAPGQLCGDSQTLCLALPGAAARSSYTCVSWNPIQERNVSVQLEKLCPPQGEGDRDRLSILSCLVWVAAGVGALGIAWMWRRKKRKKAEGAALTPPCSRHPPPEELYSEIQSRIPLESLEGPHDHSRTIYCQVQV